MRDPSFSSRKLRLRCCLQSLYTQTLLILQYICLSNVCAAFVKRADKALAHPLAFFLSTSSRFLLLQ